jgi:hypothetical protein
VREIFCLDLRLKQALQKLGFNFKKDNIIRWIDSGLEHKRIPVWLHKKFLQSDESMRYYFEVVKDRLIWQLKRRYANEQFWNKFNRLRSRGEMMKMRDLLEEEFKLDGSEVSYDLWLQHWRAPAK